MTRAHLRPGLWLALLLAPAMAAAQNPPMPVPSAATAPAVDACDWPPAAGTSYTAAAIVRTACQEHKAWLQPFIDVDGRLASMTVTEAERSRLADDTPAWQRVARYWRESGTLSALGAYPGAQSCMAAPGERMTDNDCRAFLIDNPWSAAFISWVMQRAGVPGFRTSASHFDYVRAARKDVAASPYRFVEPMSAKLETGDMLCYVRTGRVYGHEGLAKAIDGTATSLPMHCDLIVAAVDGKAYAVGGNVQQAVTLRMLRLDAQGRLSDLPMRGSSDTSCSPDAPMQCNLNRQDWVALLKLKSDPVQAGAMTAANVP